MLPRYRYQVLVLGTLVFSSISIRALVLEPCRATQCYATYVARRVQAALNASYAINSKPDKRNLNDDFDAEGYTFINEDVSNDNDNDVGNANDDDNDELPGDVRSKTVNTLRVSFGAAITKLSARYAVLNASQIGVVLNATFVASNSKNVNLNSRNNVASEAGKQI